MNKYSDKEVELLFGAIIKEIEGGLSLRACLRKENRPTSTTFFSWIDLDEAKMLQYARACSIRADGIFDEMLEIADATEADIIIKDGQEVINHNVINRDRLRVDARKWAVSKMNPKKYGEKLDVTSKDKELKSFFIVSEKTANDLLKDIPENDLDNGLQKDSTTN